MNMIDPLQILNFQRYIIVQIIIIHVKVRAGNLIKVLIFIKKGLFLIEAGSLYRTSS